MIIRNLVYALFISLFSANCVAQLSGKNEHVTLLFPDKQIWKVVNVERLDEPSKHYNYLANAFLGSHFIFSQSYYSYWTDGEPAIVGSCFRKLTESEFIATPVPGYWRHSEVRFTMVGNDMELVMFNSVKLRLRKQEFTDSSLEKVAQIRKIFFSQMQSHLTHDYCQKYHKWFEPIYEEAKLENPLFEHGIDEEDVFTPTRRPLAGSETGISLFFPSEQTWEVVEIMPDPSSTEHPGHAPLELQYYFGPSYIGVGNKLGQVKPVPVCYQKSKGIISLDEINSESAYLDSIEADGDNLIITPYFVENDPQNYKLRLERSKSSGREAELRKNLRKEVREKFTDYRKRNLSGSNRIGDLCQSFPAWFEKHYLDTGTYDWYIIKK